MVFRVDGNALRIGWAYMAALLSSVAFLGVAPPRGRTDNGSTRPQRRARRPRARVRVPRVIPTGRGRRCEISSLAPGATLAVTAAPAGANADAGAMCTADAPARARPGGPRETPPTLVALAALCFLMVMIGLVVCACAPRARQLSPGARGVRGGRRGGSHRSAFATGGASFGRAPCQVPPSRHRSPLG